MSQERMGIPRYIQIREILRQEILDGRLQAGEQLPSEHELAAQHGVSRMTLRKAIEDLVDASLLYKRHGVGTFVSQTQFERDHTRLTDFFENCRQSGRVPSARLLDYEIVPAPARVAEALQLEEGAPLIRLKTIRSIDGLPTTIHDAYLPAERFPMLREADPDELKLESRHVWQLIEACGFRVDRVMERLEARPANRWVSTLLEVEAGSPILYGERVLYADDGEPLKFADCYNHGERFALTVTLKR